MIKYILLIAYLMDGEALIRVEQAPHATEALCRAAANLRINDQGAPNGIIAVCFQAKVTEA